MSWKSSVMSSSSCGYLAIAPRAASLPLKSPPNTLPRACQTKSSVQLFVRAFMSPRLNAANASRTTWIFWSRLSLVPASAIAPSFEPVRALPDHAAGMTTPQKPTIRLLRLGRGVGRRATAAKEPRPSALGDHQRRPLLLEYPAVFADRNVLGPRIGRNPQGIGSRPAGLIPGHHARLHSLLQLPIGAEADERQRKPGIAHPRGVR